MWSDLWGLFYGNILAVYIVSWYNRITVPEVTYMRGSRKDCYELNSVYVFSLKHVGVLLWERTFWSSFVKFNVIFHFCEQLLRLIQDAVLCHIFVFEKSTVVCSSLDFAQCYFYIFYVGKISYCKLQLSKITWWNHVKS